jgi:hypothetical protein
MMVDVPSVQLRLAGARPATWWSCRATVLRDHLPLPATPPAATVYFGERTEDEMCFNFVLAWPAGALADDFGATSRRCIRAAR